MLLLNDRVRVLFWQDDQMVDGERGQRVDLWVHTDIFKSPLDSGARPHASIPDCKTASLASFGNASTLTVFCTNRSVCFYFSQLLFVHSGAFGKKNISVSCFAWSHHSVVYLLWPFLYFILFFYVLCQVGCSSLTWKGPWIGLWSGAASTLCSSLDNVVIIDTDLQQKDASLAVNWGSRS